MGAASRPRPALRAGERSLSLAFSLDPAPTCTRGTRVQAREFHDAGKDRMLRIYPIILEVLKELQPVVRRIELRDRDLARQLRRCSASIALNVAEGMYSRGNNRNARYHSALGSARETLACLELAEVCSFVSPGEVTQHPQLNRIIGTLVKLVAA